MTLQITPPVSEGQSAALRDAIVSAGVPLDRRPTAYESAWRRAASEEAIDDEPDPQDECYARLPRNTLGATSA